MSSHRSQTGILLLVILALLLAIWLIYIYFLRSPGGFQGGRPRPDRIQFAHTNPSPPTERIPLRRAQG